MTENRSELTLSRTVVLVGLMGAGKSSLGRALAARLDVPFVDADEEIEKAADLSISEIFEKYGEPEFRRGEREVMTRLMSGEPCILAAGGGAFMDDDTRALIKDQALSLWLKADLDLLDARTRGRTHRPLLMQGDSRQILADLMDKRYPVYAEADIAFDTVDEDLDTTTERALAAIRDYLAEKDDGA